MNDGGFQISMLRLPKCSAIMMIVSRGMAIYIGLLHDTWYVSMGSFDSLKHLHLSCDKPVEKRNRFIIMFTTAR